MKLATVQWNGGRRVAVADSDGQWRCVDANDAMPWLRSAQSVIENWDRFGPSFDPSDTEDIPVDQLEFLCPLQHVAKIICVGKNYADHAAEMGGEAPALPVIFSKFTSALIGPNEAIVLPTISEQVDFEAELVVVIGKRGRDIDARDASQYIFGYTIGNDVSARDWQKGRPGGQWLLGKTFDTFAPIGPWVVTADEISNSQALSIELSIELRLNGELMQRGNTRDLIFPIDFLIAHISKFVTLCPGDLIFTGTPAGVGAGRSPQVFLQHDDEVQISIAEIGTLSNRVVRQ